VNNPETLGLVLGIGLPAALLLIAWIKSNMIICHPNELVILAGLDHKQPDGSTRGFRVIRGGRGFRRPFVESVARLPLNALPVRFQLEKVLCAGMIPVVVEGMASVKLAGRAEHGMERAIERFLGKGPDGVVKAAQQAIEGALRGVIVSRAPEEANRDRIGLTSEIIERARGDLQELGIVLDFIQIQSIYDDHGYLEAIGRKRSAEVLRDARIAEATAEAEARQVAANQARVGREAEIASELVVVERENDLTVKKADLRAEANRAEQRAEVAGRITRTEEELSLEERRVKLVERREEADTVIPARAKSEARKIAAEGYAARILEEGRATAKAVEMMKEQWSEDGDRELFMIRMLPELLDKVTSVVAENLRVDRLTILDGGDGNGLPNYIQNLTRGAVSMLEQVRNATGVDIPAMANGDGASSSPSLPRDLD
jgi:flotillin